MSHPSEAATRPREVDGRRLNKRAGFRPDIQGMRALAVLAIIAYHSGLDLYPGGFVALDVFFVISGFLITHLLVLEIKRTGTLSLSNFYRRRARRILPAATVTAIATVVATWLWLSLVAAEDAATDAIWSALFAANIKFALESTDYFALGEAPSPFQHYWSLSVEEQFYLGLPLLLLGGALLARRRAGSQRAGRPIRTGIVAVAVVTALSFGWSLHASAVSPETAYFSTLTRIWEFGVGALLAMAAPKLAGALTTRARNLLAAAGLAAIAISCFIITPTTPFPGHAALLPVLGTGAIMLAGAELGTRPAPAVPRLLGVAPLRVIGDASYSLYLWHWPILTIATQHLGRDLSTRGLVFALAIIFAISFASYRYVETPFRHGNPLRLRRELMLYPIALAMVVSYSIATVTLVHFHIGRGSEPIATGDYDLTIEGKELADDSAVALVEASARAAAENGELPADLDPPLLELRDSRSDLGDCDYQVTPWNLCRRGDPDAEKTLVMLGDSHGRHWITAFEEIAERTGYAAYYLVKPQCTAARVGLAKANSDKPWQECADFNAWALDQVADLEPDLVVISTSGAPKVTIDGEVTGKTEPVVEAFRSGFPKLIEDVSPHTGEVVVLGDVPRRPDDAGECLSKRDTRLGDCAFEPVKRADQITEASREAAQQHGIRFIDTKPWFCSADVCPAVIGSMVPFRDHRHITTTYARHLAEPLRKALKLTPQ